MRRTKSFNPLLFNRAAVIFPITVAMLLLIVSTAYAQTWYIKPTAEIPLRRGQGSDYKILAIVPDGTAVTITEEDESWAKVVTRDDKEGWILKRYLTEDPPLDQRMANLQEENQSLQTKVTDLMTKNERLSQQLNDLQTTLEKNKQQLTTTTDKYAKLVNDTSDVIGLKNTLDQSKQTNVKLQQELAVISAENERLKASRNIKWFLAGGGTLIFGCLVGLFMSRSKKRKSSLY